MKNKKNLIVLLIGLIIFYLVSFGPYACTSTFAHQKAGPVELLNKIDGIFEVLYYPHFRLVYHSELYFKYINVWVRLGGYRSDQSHAAYRHLQDIYDSYPGKH